MARATALLGLLTETSLHAGAGQMVGVIDLPIQREAHTGWPCVFGSAVKGALRTSAGKAGWVTEVFGPETRNASDHAGALAVGDARLLLLPVRSLTGHFKWVTCPDVLRRHGADARRLGLAGLAEIPAVDGDRALVATGSGAGPLFLEELRFSAEESDLASLIASLASLMSREQATEALGRQLAIIGDDHFAYLARFATPVAAHVRLDPERKTVATGALWYEETLPPDTLLCTALVAEPSRRKGSAKTAAEVLDHLEKELFPAERPYLQLGGNETVGMGWCKVRLVRGEG